MLGMRIQSAQPSVVLEPNTATSPALGNGKIEELLRYVEAKYVDEVDREKLVNEAIEVILEQLDPHSSYISLEELQQVTEQLEGNFEGIGVEFTSVRDSLTVLRVIEHGPSFKSGVKAGDRITIVNNDTIAGIPMSNSDSYYIFVPFCLLTKK